MQAGRLLLYRACLLYKPVPAGDFQALFNNTAPGIHVGDDNVIIRPPVTHNPINLIIVLFMQSILLLQQ